MCNEKLLIEATGCEGIKKRSGEGNQCKVGYQTVRPRKLKSAWGRETHAAQTVSVPVASIS